MRGILINPEDKTVTEIETPGGLDELYRLVNCRTVEVVDLGGGQDLWLDEEGLLTDDPGPFFAFIGREAHPFCGRGLILSNDGQGNSTSTTLRLSAVSKLIVWPDIEFAGFAPVETSTGEDGGFVISTTAKFKPKETE